MEVRALLDLIRDNTVAAQRSAALCQEVLEDAMAHLALLDPKVGEQQLIKAMAVERGRLASGMAGAAGGAPPLHAVCDIVFGASAAGFNPKPKTLNPKP